jgi:hypothetical protein
VETRRRTEVKPTAQEEPMMKNSLRVAAALFLVAAASRADAFPAFARKYGMSCTACHIGWPILNQQGERFRDQGYQFGLGKDDPTALSPAYVPFAIRTTAAYNYLRTTNQTADDLSGTGGTKPVTTSSGGFPQPTADILTGGSVSPEVSYLVVVAGFGPDEPGAIESGWVRLNRLGGSSWANLRLGKFELDSPASAHRGVTLTAGYAAYSAALPGSAVAFDMGENQVGIELTGADDRSSLRYAISLTSVDLGANASKGAWSTPMIYGHLQKSFETGSRVLPWVRIGALAAVGSVPTKFEYAPGGTDPLPGTGSANKSFSRVGAELAGILGNPSTPLFFTLAYLHGQEPKGLASGIDASKGTDYSTVSNSFNGGFLEIDWVPWSEASENATPWMFFARYDAVTYKYGGKGTVPDPAVEPIPGDTSGFTVGARRYLALGPRASAAIHVEFHQDKTKGIGWVDPATNLARSVETQALLAGIDFDF